MLWDSVFFLVINNELNLCVVFMLLKVYNVQHRIPLEDLEHNGTESQHFERCNEKHIQIRNPVQEVYRVFWRAFEISLVFKQFLIKWADSICEGIKKSDPEHRQNDILKTPYKLERMDAVRLFVIPNVWGWSHNLQLCISELFTGFQ